MALHLTTTPEADALLERDPLSLLLGQQLPMGKAFTARRMSGPAGFGAQEAKVLTALLGKQMGVRPVGFDDASRLQVRDTKKKVEAAARADTA